jgi:hypothetical protein
VTLGQVAIHPAQARIGDTLRIAFTVHNPAPQSQDVLVDLQVHYIKANGAASPKVFKVKTVELGAGQTVHLRKTVSLADMSTRRHHPGEHRVDVLVNGQAMPLGRFELLPPAPL